MDRAPAYELRFLTDPAAFLDLAGDHLGAEPVVATIVTTMAHRAVGAADAPGPINGHSGASTPPRWWLAVLDEAGRVRGAGMRTAPFEPYPPYLLPMPDEAALALARQLHDRGEPVQGVNGALPATRIVAEELVRLRGGRIDVDMHTRLFELGDLVPPAPAAGRLVAATEEDLPLVSRWWHAFHLDADAQAGREPGASHHEAPGEEDLRRRVRAGVVWLWVTPGGERVHLTGANPPAFGVARVGPVYTPPEQRGRGYAASAVAEVSRLLTEAGSRACLFTDQANPVSNRLYLALGYRPVLDMVSLLLLP